jgi:hypothetical protein
MNDKWLPAVIVAALLIAMGYALHADLQQPIPSALQAGRPPQTETNKDQERAGGYKGVPPNAIDRLPSPQAQSGTNDHKAQSDSKTPTDWWLAIFTGGLVLVGVLQLFVFGRQAQRLRESVDLTREVSARQERDMAASITEASRAATAMEQVAAGITANTENSRILIERPRVRYHANARVPFG